MKRRDFLKGLAGVVAGTVVAPSVVKAKPKRPVVVDFIKAKEVLEEKYGRSPAVESIRPDGAYLEGSEIECARCGKIHKLEKGYYVFGDKIDCQCGNRYRFIMWVKAGTNN
jgi:hypothetical protein